MEGRGENLLFAYDFKFLSAKLSTYCSPDVFIDSADEHVTLFPKVRFWCTLQGSNLLPVA